MAENTISSLARMNVKPGYEEAWKKVVVEFVTETRKEPGCISYDWFQSCDNPTMFAFCERWRGSEAIQVHIQTPQFQLLMAKAAEMLLPAVPGTEGPFEVMICSPYTG